MSVKVPPEGSRGATFPRFIPRLFGRLTAGMFRRRPNKTGGGVPTLLLETKGAKSGKTRHAILGYLEEGSDGGWWSPRSPALRGSPAGSTTWQSNRRPLSSSTGVAGLRSKHRP